MLPLLTQDSANHSGISPSMEYHPGGLEMVSVPSDGTPTFGATMNAMGGDLPKYNFHPDSNILIKKDRVDL